MFKIAITDASWGDVSVEISHLPKNADVVFGQCRTEEEVIELCRDADAVLSEYAPITRHVMSQLERCKIISNSATGYDNIDAAAAREMGIAVANVPVYCTEEVANHVWSLLLSQNRRLLSYSRIGASGDWSLESAPKLRRLSGTVLGLIGYGNIARAVAKRAKAFDMEVISATNVPQGLLDEYDVERVRLEELYERADFISVHKPLTKATEKLLNKDAFLTMKRRPYLINTSRGGLIDEGDLLWALESEKLSGAALDVLTQEPPAAESPIVKSDKTLVTPHVGFYSEESVHDVRKASALNVKNFLKGHTDLVFYV